MLFGGRKIGSGRASCHPHNPDFDWYLQLQSPSTSRSDSRTELLMELGSFSLIISQTCCSPPVSLIAAGPSFYFLFATLFWLITRAATSFLDSIFQILGICARYPSCHHPDFPQFHWVRSDQTRFWSAMWLPWPSSRSIWDRASLPCALKELGTTPCFVIVDVAVVGIPSSGFSLRLSRKIERFVIAVFLRGLSEI